MKTTRSIDEITTEVKIGCTDAMGGVHKVYIPLTEEAKAELLATILASMPDPDGYDDEEMETAHRVLSDTVEAIKKIFQSTKDKE